MMKTYERREALVGWLRGRPGGTAAQASARFGVTERTILRDIAALRAQGEPIVSSSGPGGGFYLDSTSRLPGVRLSVEEVLGLTLAASMASQLQLGLPYAQAGTRAIDRLIATLPRERAVRLRNLVARITVGLPVSTPAQEHTAQVDGALLGMFETAFRTSRVMEFTYTDRKGGVTTRAIEPHGLLLQLPVWYVVAHDRLRDDARMFRIDRMSQVALRDETFSPRPASCFAEYFAPCPLGTPHQP